MQVEKTVTIRSETDSCYVSRGPDGRICISSTAIKDEELPEFLKALSEAAASIESPKTPPTP